MTQTEIIPEGYRVDSAQPCSATDVVLTADAHGRRVNFALQTLSERLFRCTFSSDRHPLPPHPSAPTPQSTLSSSSAKVSTPSPTSKTIEVGDVVEGFGNLGVKAAQIEGQPDRKIAFPEGPQHFQELLGVELRGGGRGVLHLSPFGNGGLGQNDSGRMALR